MNVLSDQEKELARELTEAWRTENAVFELAELLMAAKDAPTCLRLAADRLKLILDADGTNCFLFAPFAPGSSSMPDPAKKAEPGELKSMGGHQDKRTRAGIPENAASWIADDIKLPGGAAGGVLAAWRLDPNRPLRSPERNRAHLCASLVSLTVGKLLLLEDRRLAYEALRREVLYQFRSAAGAMDRWLDVLDRKAAAFSTADGEQLLETVGRVRVEAEKAEREIRAFLVDWDQQRKRTVTPVRPLLEELVGETPDAANLVRFGELAGRVWANRRRVQAVLRDILYEVLELAEKLRVVAFIMTERVDDRIVVRYELPLTPDLAPAIEFSAREFVQQLLLIEQGGWRASRDAAKLVISVWWPSEEDENVDC